MPANVEWSAFNAAVREHAARETAKFYGLPQPKPELAPAPSSFVPVAALIAQDTSGQFLRRAQGVALVALAVGAAVALVLWAHESFTPRTVIEQITAPAQVAAVPPVVALPAPVVPLTLPPNVTAPTTEAKPAGPEVVNYTRFTTRNVDGLEVTTGWKWTNSHDTEPYRQFCYVSLQDPQGGASRMAHIAVNGVEIPYDSATMHPLTAEQYVRGVGACSWFKPAPSSSVDPTLAPKPDAPSPETTGSPNARWLRKT